jgi:hypothetical protein
VPFHEEPSGPYYALIYLYRQPGLTGGAGGWEVSLDDISVGRIFPKAYMTIHVAPGTHWLRIGEGVPLMIGVAPQGAVAAGLAAAIHSPPQTMEFKARSGETYYLRCTGREREFVTREDAIDTLRTMKYDRGD